MFVLLIVLKCHLEKQTKKPNFLCVKFFAAFFAPRLNKKHLKTIRLGLRNIYLRNCQISGLSDKTTNAESANPD